MILLMIVNKIVQENGEVRESSMNVEYVVELVFLMVIVIVWVIF